jgi:hypothetical protein
VSVFRILFPPNLNLFGTTNKIYDSTIRVDYLQKPTTRRRQRY